MKIYFSIIVLPYIMLTFLDMVSSTQIGNCYSCDGKFHDCKMRASVCVEPEENENTTTPADTATEASTTPPARLIERQKDSDSIMTLVPMNPILKAPLIAWKCLTISGKQDKDGEKMIWKGCGFACDKSDDPKRHTFPYEEECVACDNADLCNLSVRINPVGWISLMMALMWVETM